MPCQPSSPPTGCSSFHTVFFFHALCEQVHLVFVLAGSALCGPSLRLRATSRFRRCPLCRREIRTSTPRLLTKACSSLPKTRASELKRLSEGLEPNRRTVCRMTRQFCQGVFTLIATRDLIVISPVTEGIIRQKKRASVPPDFFDLPKWFIRGMTQSRSKKQPTKRRRKKHNLQVLSRHAHTDTHRCRQTQTRAHKHSHA